MEVPSALIEIQNRIASQLPWAMVGRLTTSVGFKNWKRHGGPKARLIPCATDCVNRLMLEKDERFLSGSSNDISNQAVLQIESCCVIEATGFEDVHNF
jgi:hypothetical protein